MIPREARITPPWCFLQSTKVALGQPQLQVFDFDDATGQVAPNPIEIPFQSYGIGLSPNGQFLYSSYGQTRLIQYDLMARNSTGVINSADTVYRHPW
ncbi:MAG: hypothetical protein U5L96_19190 [Owenweeksia sp.]|nr:hypothetical protein [Owenweeksia sp.]